MISDLTKETHFLSCPPTHRCAIHQGATPHVTIPFLQKWAHGFYPKVVAEKQEEERKL